VVAIERDGALGLGPNPALGRVGYGDGHDYGRNALNRWASSAGSASEDHNAIGSACNEYARLLGRILGLREAVRGWRWNGDGLVRRVLERG
jgi:hypothetical protein